MDYYCDVCDKYIEPKSKYKHFKSKSHEQFDKCKHIISSHKDIDIYDVDECFFYTISNTMKLLIFIL